MPSLEELLLVAFGFSCFYPSSTPRSCPPSWATLVWDVPQLEKGSAPEGTTMAQVLYWSIPALGLLLLLLFLSRTYWRKRCGRKHGCSCKTSKLLCKLKEDPDLLKLYLKHLQKCRTSFVDVFQKNQQEYTGGLRGGGEDTCGCLPMNSQL